MTEAQSAIERLKKPLREQNARRATEAIEAKAARAAAERAEADEMFRLNVPELLREAADRVIFESFYRNDNNPMWGNQARYYVCVPGHVPIYMTLDHLRNEDRIKTIAEVRSYVTTGSGRVPEPARLGRGDSPHPFDIGGAAPGAANALAHAMLWAEQKYRECLEKIMPGQTPPHRAIGKRTTDEALLWLSEQLYGMPAREFRVLADLRITACSQVEAEAWARESLGDHGRGVRLADLTLTGEATEKP